MAIPLIGTAFAWAMSKMVWPIVVRIAVGLGLTVTVYSGMNVLLDNLKNQVFGSLSGLSGIALDLSYLAGFDQVVTIVFSAITLKLTIQGVREGSRSVIGMKPPGV